MAFTVCYDETEWLQVTTFTAKNIMKFRGPAKHLIKSKACKYFNYW